MKCPYCASNELKVVDKRDSEGEQAIRRRRECLKCSKRFTTYERIELADISVVKRDGGREPFERKKLISGILRACEKRPISHENVEFVVDAIEQKLRKLETTEITSKRIGEEAAKALRRIDKVAYIRFASVYYSFEDIESFETELKKLTNGKSKKR